LKTFNNFIAETIGFPVQDIIKGTKILPALRFLRKSQYWNDEQKNEYRLKKLQLLVNYAYKFVPYYKDMFDAINLKPNDIKKLEDIKKIPVLTKEIARKNQKKLVSVQKNLKLIKKGKTGGTTGVPLVLYSDTSNRSFTWGSYYRWYEWIGIKKSDKVLTLWGARTVLSTKLLSKILYKLKVRIQNNKTINTFTINTETLPDVYQQIIKFNPVLIKGYLSSIILLAKYMDEHKLPPNKSLKAVSSTTETLLPMYREYIEKVLDVPVYDQYGCGEVSAIAYECSSHNGLHVNEEHVIIETMDEKGNEIINQSGRFIITNLDNFVMPFIRYENGDEGILHDKKCSCGVNSQLLSSIEGRTADTVKLKTGAHVHGVFFTDILFELGITTDVINRFQVYQYKTGAIDFILETNNIISQNLIDELNKHLLIFLNEVNIKVVNFISSDDNGKFRYIKCES